MIICDFEQGTPEWFTARAGVVTASCFDKIITSTGKPSTQARKYMMQLAGERIIKAKEDSYQNSAMTRGIEMEPEARSLYEMINGTEVTEVGMCYLDDNKKVSCSPDGLVGDEGGLEIKCPSLAVHVEYLVGGKLPIAYLQQVQGSIFVTGREWWDFMSYYPGMRPLIVRVERDAVFHMHLSSSIKKFIDELDKLTETIR